MHIAWKREGIGERRGRRPALRVGGTANGLAWKKNSNGSAERGKNTGRIEPRRCPSDKGGAFIALERGKCDVGGILSIKKS